MKSLLIDAGNTRIKWALIENDHWLLKGALPVEKSDALNTQWTENIHKVWASNVAGETVAQSIRHIESHTPAVFITARPLQCGVRNGYEHPAQLGSDRWAALIASWNLLHQECLVVNCGTAMTVDALNRHGEFMGGLILPGIALMQFSLIQRTAQLNTEHGKYELFPTNTADAIRSGAIQASCGAIHRQYGLLENQHAPIILSGGASSILHPHLNHLPVQTEDDLVLQGLKLIAREAEA